MSGMSDSQKLLYVHFVLKAFLVVVVAFYMEGLVVDYVQFKMFPASVYRVSSTIWDVDIRADHYDELVAGGTLVRVRGKAISGSVPPDYSVSAVREMVSTIGQDSQGYYAVIDPMNLSYISDAPDSPRRLFVLAPTKLYLGESAPGFADNGVHVNHKVGTITFVALESSSVWFVVHYDTPQ